MMKYLSVALSAAIVFAALPKTSHAAVLAFDDFSSYTPGSIIGQPAGGTGFSGNWKNLQAGNWTPTENIEVYPDQTAGSQGTRFFSTAGSWLDFASPININGGQLFIRQTYTIGGNSPFQASRLDLNFNGTTIGAMFGGTYGALDLVVRSPIHSGNGDIIANTGISTPGTYNLVAFLDAKHGQFGLWVNPDANDFYDPSTGANSADAISLWSIPSGGLPNFTSYSLVRNLDSTVKFDNITFATASQDVGIAAVPEPATGLGLLVGGMGLAFLRQKKLAASNKRVG